MICGIPGYLNPPFLPSSSNFSFSSTHNFLPYTYIHCLGLASTFFWYAQAWLLPFTGTCRDGFYSLNVHMRMVSTLSLYMQEPFLLFHCTRWHRFLPFAMCPHLYSPSVLKDLGHSFWASAPAKELFSSTCTLMHTCIRGIRRATCPSCCSAGASLHDYKHHLVRRYANLFRTSKVG